MRRVVRVKAVKSDEAAFTAVSMVLGLVRFRVNLVCPTLARCTLAMTDTMAAIELGAEEEGAVIPFNKVTNDLHFAWTPAILEEEVRAQPRRQCIEGHCKRGLWRAGPVYEECRGL
jgi:hypothetical protein